MSNAIPDKKFAIRIMLSLLAWKGNDLKRTLDMRFC